jgi:DNA-binding IclR family transcriptional regulator
LACLLDPGASGRTWTQTELAEASGLGKKGSVDVHLAGLLQVGVVEREGSRYSVDAAGPLARALTALLNATQDLPERPIDFAKR